MTVRQQLHSYQSRNGVGRQMWKQFHTRLHVKLVDTALFAKVNLEPVAGSTRLASSTRNLRKFARRFACFTDCSASSRRSLSLFQRRRDWLLRERSAGASSPAHGSRR